MVRVSEGAVSKDSNIDNNLNKVEQQPTHGFSKGRSVIPNTGDTRTKAELKHLIKRDNVGNLRERFENIAKMQDKTLENKLSAQKSTVKLMQKKQDTKFQNDKKTTVTQKSSLDNISPIESQEIYDGIVAFIHNAEDYEKETDLYNKFIDFIKPLSLNDKINLLSISLTVRPKTRELATLDNFFIKILTSPPGKQPNNYRLLNALVQYKISSTDMLNSIIKASEMLSDNSREGYDPLYKAINYINLEFSGVDQLNNTIIEFVAQLSKEQVQIILKHHASKYHQKTVDLVKKYNPYATRKASNT